MSITWTRTNQLKATIAGLAAAVLIWLAFESYLAPLAIAITTLHVAWNRNNTVTMREWRLLATVIAGSITFLGIPTLQERFPHNYTLVALVIVAGIATFWIPFVWRMIGGGANPPKAAKKEAKTSPARAVLVALMLILVLTPNASAANQVKCPYAEPPAGTIQTHDYIMPQPGEEACTQAQLHNKGSLVGGIGEGSRAPLCNDFKRLSMKRETVRVTDYKVTPTAVGDDVDLQVSLQHQFSGTACMTTGAINAVLKPKADAGEMTCLAMTKACGWGAPVGHNVCLTPFRAASECNNDLVGGKPSKCWIPEGCGNTAILPSAYTVTITAKSGNKVVTLHKETVELGDSTFVIGADGRATKIPFQVEVENLGQAFAAAKAKVPKTVYVVSSVAYSYEAPECPNNVVGKFVSKAVGNCKLAKRTVTGIASKSVKLPSTACTSKALNCAGFSGWRPAMGNFLHIFDNKIPGINPGIGVGGLLKQTLAAKS